MMATSLLAHAARPKTPAQFLSRGVCTGRLQRIKRTAPNKFSGARGRFIFANVPFRPTTPPLSQQKIKYTSQNINGSNNPIFYETKKHLQANVNSVQNIHQYKALFTRRVLLKPNTGYSYAKVASNYSTLTHKRYYYTDANEKAYARLEDADDIRNQQLDEDQCPTYDMEHTDNECVLNIYVDTEQTKIQERNNFVQFLEELAESEEANLAIRSKICSFLATNQYETILYAKL